MPAKGQLILECSFGVFKSQKKKNEKFSMICALASKRGQMKKLRTLYTTNWRILC